MPSEVWLRRFVLEDHRISTPFINRLYGTLILLTLVFGGPANAQELVLLAADERPPFHFTSSEGHLEGVAITVLDCAMKRLSQTYSVTMLPWKRAQRQVKEGTMHGFFAASHNSDRDAYAELSSIIADQYWNWYVMKDSDLDPTAAAFKGSGKVASWLGSNSQKWLVDSGYEPAPPSAKVDMLLNRLLVGELAAAFGSNFLIESIISKRGLQSDIEIFDGPHKPMGIYFSKPFLAENPGFLDRFNGAVGKCS